MSIEEKARQLLDLANSAPEEQVLELAAALQRWGMAVDELIGNTQSGVAIQQSVREAIAACTTVTQMIEIMKQAAEQAGGQYLG